MDKKKTGTILTIVTAVLCGCPGLFGLCFGSITALNGFIPGAEIDLFGSSDPSTAIAMGIGTLCVSIIFIAIPIVIGVVMLRKKPEAATEVPPSEPLPPTA
jgi:hypothetical protein